MNYRGLRPPKGRNDFSHKVAKLLLKQIFCEILRNLQDVSLKNIDLLIEATRIIALNLIISRCLRLNEEEVSRNPKIGITCISNKHLDEPEVILKIFRLVFENISRFKNSPLLTDVEKLDRYDLVKILEAIHEVSVYAPLEFIKESVVNSGFYINEANGTRKQRGAFYTPTEITEFICENSVGRFLDERINNISKVIEEASAPTSEVFNEIKRIFEINIVDPACGPGTFLSSSLKVLEARRCRLLEIVKKLRMHPLPETEKLQVSYWISILENKNEFLKYFESRLYGVDLDSAALEVASICLSLLSGRDPLLEGLKVLYMANFKEGNSLISELPPKSVKLDSKELQILLDLRRKVYCGDLDKKNKIVKDYKDMVTQLQHRSPTTQTVKRASKFFKDLNEKMAFCWELEFPEVFYNDDGNPERGFDLLVMNPPYDLLKPNRLEYTRLYGSKDISAIGFENFKRILNEEVEFYRKSGHYSLAISNVLNLYKLMLERALRITSPHGMLGFIVPSTLLCDESAAQLRKEILNKYKIEGIFDFLESAKVFQGVSQAVCIMIINKSSRGNGIPLAMNLTQIDDLEKITPAVISMDWVKDFSGFRIPKVTETGWKILKKIHVNPKLSDIPWILNLRGEVDLTLYKDCLSTKDTGYPLVRGVDISRYVLRRGYRKKESFIHREKFLDMLGNSIKAKHVEDRRIAGQQISNMMQRWRLKFCMVEAGTFLGNSCNYIYIKEEQNNRESLYLYFLALLNSTLLNWRFKLTSTNNHVSNTELGTLPIKLIDMSDTLERRIFNLIVERVRDILKNGVSRFDAQIEAAIFFLYGLTGDEVKFVLRSEKATEQEARNVLETFYKLKKIDVNLETLVV
jgi:Alw26I/Eco31I/Esp3I family type II restriction m6 adenine DNA methyltransferase